MKKLLFVLFFMIPVIAMSQVERPDYGKLPSVVIPPQQYYMPFEETDAVVKTINGFDNFYLGVDFGEPYIVSNPNDPLNAVCAFNINNLYYTLDGFNWTKNNPGFPGFGVLGDPVLTYDSLGTVYYVTLYQNGSTYGLALVKSTNKGVTWSPPYSVYGTTVGLADKEWITADRTAGPYSNRLYAAWRQFGSSGMRITRSTNGGVNWATPTTLAGDQGAYIAVGPNGNIQGGSVYFAATLGSYIVCYRSTNGGETFGAYVLATPYIFGPGTICYGRYTVKNCIRCDYMPRMAADNSYTSTRGNVYIVYAANPNSGPDKANVYLVRSTDYGATWSAPLKVNDDNTNSDQWMPAVSVDKNGRVIVTWYDSRIDPTNNVMTEMYSAISTNGGVSFLPNQPVSNTSFNPNNMAVGQGSGQANYIGDYIGNNPVGNKTAWHVWMDARDNNLGSYTGYYPDFAMTLSSSKLNFTNNDSAAITVKVPAIKGPFSDRVKFTVSVDTLPVSGTLQMSFQNGKDSITSFPDSIYLRIKAIGNVNTRLYKITVSGAGTNGTPVHKRIIDLYMNLSVVSVGTNREGTADFKVNGVSYNTRQTFVFPNSSVVNVQAISPKTVGGSNYVFLNWSDNGDTAHNITVNQDTYLTAFYKVQYKLIVNSFVGNAFGNNTFTDSSSSATFGVNSKYFTYNNTLYQFRGWNGAGPGAYTSPDSTGNDTVVSVNMIAAIVESARWTPAVGISKIGNEIPVESKLYQNYPNPFNPSTKINYDLNENTFVSIKVYDMLGREVSVIINDNLPAGRYQADFNAAMKQLTSGIYYYSYTAGNYTEIRKMAYIK